MNTIIIIKTETSTKLKFVFKKTTLTIVYTYNWGGRETEQNFVMTSKIGNAWILSKSLQYGLYKYAG